MTPAGGNIVLSALVAAIPIFTLLLLLGVLRQPPWLASLVSLAAAAAIASGVYGMPAGKLAATVTYGAAFGLFPIGWIVLSAILLYRIVLESGKFELLKDSIGHLSADPRLQALLIAFAFGAFLEGAAGFGTPVAVAAAMLTGLGFSPFYAAAICLLANTAPVAFGSIGIPVATLAATTGLPLDRLSAGVGRICAPVSLIVPAYLVLVMSGWKGLRAVLPAAALCGAAFAGTQFLVSNFVSAQLTDILASIAAIAAVIMSIRGRRQPSSHSAREIVRAWMPYGLLVIFVLLWGYKPVQARLDSLTLIFHWPGLPTAQPYRFNWLSAAGTACLFAALLSVIVTGLKPREMVGLVKRTAKQLALPELTFAVVLALAFVMNYSGATATLGTAFAATGALFPFFSALLGWLGVFLTGSDTSANALFGTLQVVTAHKLHMNPVLMAAANSAGGVMGKMISLASIAVAAAATSMKRADEAMLFRFTLKHSVLLASITGLLVVFYAYVAPSWAP